MLPEPLPLLQKLLRHNITQVRKVIQPLLQRLERRALVRLDADVHLRLRGVRNRVPAELDVGAACIVSGALDIPLDWGMGGMAWGDGGVLLLHDDIPQGIPERVVFVCELERGSCVGGPRKLEAALVFLPLTATQFIL